MCRILSISGKIEYKEISLILKKFQRLAEYGKVPGDSEGGHKDGWGILAYKKGQPCLFVRNYKNAFNDSEYLKATESLKDKKSDMIISHLRKASVGIKNINNAHPFVYSNHSFCQNGTVFDSKKIPLNEKSRKMLKGTTDSERLFAFVLQNLRDSKKTNPAAIRMAIEKSIKYIRNNFDFTAMNVVFSDGKHIWALREVNEENKFVKKYKLMKYYSLFLGSGKGFNVISSEKLAARGTKWKALKNHELVEIFWGNGKIEALFI